MTQRTWLLVWLVAGILLFPGNVRAQSPSADALAAARDLVIAAEMTDQIKVMLPTIMDQLKPLIVRGSPQAERDYDLLIPSMVAAMNAQLSVYVDKVTEVYARHFTADELKQVTAFYRTPAGQKFVRSHPVILQKVIVVAQEFAQSVAADVQARMKEELRKRGHTL